MLAISSSEHWSCLLLLGRQIKVIGFPTYIHNQTTTDGNTACKVFGDIMQIDKSFFERESVLAAMIAERDRMIVSLIDQIVQLQCELKEVRGATECEPSK